MRTHLLKTENLLMVAAVLLAGTAPNLFAISQAGYMKFSTLGKIALLPSAAGLIGLIVFTLVKYPRLGKKLLAGASAGIIATLGLELVREIGFHMGAMPGDLPKLMGVQLLDRFMSGPSLLSNIAGWGYHFWNGASFGIILALLLGGTRRLAGVIYGLLIGVGFMASPVVTALGIGRFGVLFGPGFAVTVVLAHAAFGLILGLLLARWSPEKGVIAELFSGGECSECRVEGEAAC